MTVRDMGTRPEKAKSSPGAGQAKREAFTASPGPRESLKLTPVVPPRMARKAGTTVATSLSLAGDSKVQGVQSRSP